MSLRPSAGRLEPFALSLATMAPTLAMSFTPPLAAQAAGRAVPLVYLTGGIAVAIVAYSFVRFSRRVVGAGSTMAYVDHVFGRTPAFAAGWTMLLAYGTIAIGAAAMVGNFVAIAAAHAGIGGHATWLIVAVLAAIVGTALSRRRLSTATHAGLILEGLSVLAILVLAVAILWRAPASVPAFVPAPGKGWGGIGSALVFSVLAFAGFEAGTTLSEETRGARRAIPFTLIASVLVVTVFFVVVSFAQIVGFGGDAAALAGSAAPLDALSSRYLGGSLATLLDLAAAISALACTISSITAGARLAYALGQAGLARRLLVVDEAHDVPRNAILVVGGIVTAVPLIGAALGIGGNGLANNLLTLGTLTLIVSYAATCGAQAVLSGRERAIVPALLGWIGLALLVWIYDANAIPAPAWPGNVWPWLALVWAAAGLVMGSGIGRRRTNGERRIIKGIRCSARKQSSSYLRNRISQ